MWWCEVIYVVALNLCHLCGGVRSPMWWCAVIYVTYVVVRVPMSRMWWRLNLCHLCGGVCPYVTYVVAF